MVILNPETAKEESIDPKGKTHDIAINLDIVDFLNRRDEPIIILFKTARENNNKALIIFTIVSLRLSMSMEISKVEL